MFGMGMLLLPQLVCVTTLHFCYGQPLLSARRMNYQSKCHSSVGQAGNVDKIFFYISFHVLIRSLTPLENTSNLLGYYRYQRLQKTGFSAVSFQTAFYRLSAISRKKADFHGKRLKLPPWDFPLGKITVYQSEHFGLENFTSVFQKQGGNFSF